MSNFKPYGAYIVACKRTASGKNKGSLKDVNAISLMS
jgi:acetyl-CoA acetyltransferase